VNELSKEELLKKWQGSRDEQGQKLDMLAKFDLGTEGAKASKTTYQNCKRSNVL
jgi:hypothetical protein